MVDRDQKMWEGILAHLQAHHPSICRRWFDEIEPLGIKGGVFPLRALTGVHRDYLQKHCIEQFTEAAQAESGRLLSVRFLGPEEGFEAPASASESNSHTPDVAHNGDAIPALDMDDGSPTLNPDYAFEHFVTGPANQLAHVASLAVADRPGKTYNPLFIHGPVGLGKTHLLQAICLHLAEQSPELRVYYTSCEGFMSHFWDAVQTHQMKAFREWFREVDVLVIDDIHFVTKRDRTQEEFFFTFKALYERDKQIILSSDAPPDLIPDLGERLVSRFKWGLVAGIDRPSYETKVEILKSKARLRGFDLPDEAACEIAGRIDSNIRELEGAITSVQVLAMMEKVPASAALVQRALGPERAVPTSDITLPVIVDKVSEFYDVKLPDLQSKRRHRSIALPRQVCMYLARRHTRHSLEEIGGFFGGRDHTTVMHAVKTIESRCESTPDFEIVVRSLEDRLRQ